MKIQLRSKLARRFWRFGHNLSPDNYTTFEVVDESEIPREKNGSLRKPGDRKGKFLGLITKSELESIKPECKKSVKDGGTLEIREAPDDAVPGIEIVTAKATTTLFEPDTDEDALIDDDPEEDDESEDSEEDYDDMSYSDLKALAADRNLEPESLKKSDLISALRGE